MDPIEKIKQIEAELDSLLELKSRSQCQDELYAFASSTHTWSSSTKGSVNTLGIAWMKRVLNMK